MDELMVLELKELELNPKTTENLQVLFKQMHELILERNRVEQLIQAVCQVYLEAHNLEGNWELTPDRAKLVRVKEKGKDEKSN